MCTQTTPKVEGTRVIVTVVFTRMDPGNPGNPVRLYEHGI